MKSRVCALIGFVMAAQVDVEAREMVTFAIGDWPPYTSVNDANCRWLETLVARALQTQGLSVEYHYQPWKRSYVNAKDGVFDGTFPWVNTQEHIEDFHFNSVPMYTEEAVYFHLKDTAFDWQTLEDLQRYKVGVTLGYKEELLYQQYGIEAEAATSDEINFRKLLLRRIEVYQSSMRVGYTLIHKLFSPEQINLFTHHAKPALENPLYMLFSKNIEDGAWLAARFDAGLAAIKQTGEYEKINTHFETSCQP